MAKKAKQKAKRLEIKEGIERHNRDAKPRIGHHSSDRLYHFSADQTPYFKNRFEIDTYVRHVEKIFSSSFFLISLWLPLTLVYQYGSSNLYGGGSGVRH